MSDNESNAVHRWNADRPGERPEDDRLSRTPFAEQVAKDLRAWRQKDSLVVSLSGEWGSGKTTLANLILYYIDEQASRTGEVKPTVVKFNPWQWSGQDKVLEGFFGEIGAVFRSGKGAGLANAERLASFWDGLRAVTVASGELARQLQDSITAASAMLAGGSGVLSAYVQSGAGRTVLSFISMALLGIASVSAVYAPLAEKLAEFFHWKTKERRRPLDEVRRELKKELTALAAPLIVVIDDIDRLTKREVRLLVQLVKANADFPNVVYLLLYQRSAVAEALKGISGKSGLDFLRKIVQVDLDVPFAPEHEMRELFRSQMTPVLERAVIRWDRDRWGRLFDDIIWPYFRTPRDIKRFKGILDFYYEAHVIEGYLDVNPIDLVLAEILRMFDPVAYDAVSRAFQKQRSIILHLYFGDKEAQKEVVLAVKELVERDGLDGAQGKRLRSLLLDLFPQAQESFSVSGKQEQEWDRDLRICHYKHFPKYFQLGGDPGDVTAAFVAKLFKQGAKREDLRELLKKAFDEGRFVALMERIKAVREDVSSSMVGPLITALFDLSDDLPEAKTRTLLSSDAETELFRVVVVLLWRVQDQNKRALVFRESVMDSQGITGPVICVSNLQPTKKEEETIQDLPIELESLARIRGELLPKFWAAARGGRLWRLRTVGPLIFRLRDWSGANDVREWLAEALLEPRPAMAFLRAMLHETEVSGGRGAHMFYTLYAKQIEEFTDLGKLAEKAALASTDELERCAVAALQKAVANKKAGEPYEKIYVVSRGTDGQLLHNPADIHI